MAPNKNPTELKISCFREENKSLLGLIPCHHFLSYKTTAVPEGCVRYERRRGATGRSKRTAPS